MKILAVDSSAGVAAVALTENGKVLADYTLNSGNTHSTTLLPMIESILSVLSLKASDIDLFVLSAGPGSFTGLRIGAATIKGLAFANNTPCVGVSSLEAMAENFRDTEALVCPVINARRGQVYCALFRCKNGKSERLLDDDTLQADELADILLEYDDERLFFTGDASDIMCSLYTGANKKSSPVPMSLQNAVGAAFLGERKYLDASPEQRAEMTAESLAPLYLKKPQAEREREEKEKAENSAEQ